MQIRAFCISGLTLMFLNNLIHPAEIRLMRKKIKENNRLINNRLIRCPKTGCWVRTIPNSVASPFIRLQMLPTTLFLGVTGSRIRLKCLATSSSIAETTWAVPILLKKNNTLNEFRLDPAEQSPPIPAFWVQINRTCRKNITLFTLLRLSQLEYHSHTQNNHWSKSQKSAIGSTKSARKNSRPHRCRGRLKNKF
jgi:hypothetical protein